MAEGANAERAANAANATTSAATRIANRGYAEKTPRGYNPAVTSPLIVALHGYGGTGQALVESSGLLQLADERTFFVAYPDGTLDPAGRRFWNATDACCNFFHSPVDDVAYLAAVVDDMQRRFRIDAKRVFVVGFSNGGFMAHRIACDLAPRVAAIVSIAGAQWKDETRCHPTEPVSVVEAHDTADPVVPAGGGVLFARGDGAPAPSMNNTVASWAIKNGCAGPLTKVGSHATPLRNIASISRYDGCPSTGAVELWVMHEGTHVPAFGKAWAAAVYDFFMAHPKR